MRLLSALSTALLFIGNLHAQFAAPIVIAEAEASSESTYAMDNNNLLSYADLDGDGTHDILTLGQVAEDLRTPIWYRGLGGGAYAPAQRVSDSWTTSSDIYALVAMDASGDGVLDVLTVNRNISMPGFAVWVGYHAGLGAGIFASEPVVVDSLGTTQLNLWPVLAKVGDVDGDLINDLVLGFPSVFGVEIPNLLWYRNEVTTGLGVAQTILNTGAYGLSSIDLGDVDGNGTIDVVYSKDGVDDQVAYCPGTGGGSFGPSVVVGAPSGPRRLRVNDVDADGDLDLLVAGVSNAIYEFRIYTNVGSGLFSAGDSTAVGITDPGPFAFINRNQDAFPDLIVSSITENRSIVFLNDGSGFSTIADTLPIGAGQVAVQEGATDLVLATYVKTGLVEHRFNGSAWSISPVCTVLPESRTYMDVDDDGAQDVVFMAAWGALMWLRNEQGGTFSRARILRTGLENRLLLGLLNRRRYFPADVDGDGDVDLVVSGPGPISSSHKGLMVLLNEGNGVFGEPMVIAWTWNDEAIFRFLDVRDMDGDGDPDITFFRDDTNYIYYLINDGTGSFTWTSRYTSTFFMDMYPYDWDGDGLVDLLGRYTTGSSMFRLGRYMNLGATGFSGPITVQNTYPPGGFKIIDLDGDELGDLLGVDDMWWRNTGSGTFDPPQALSELVGVGHWEGDLDQDGLVDLLLFSEGVLKYARGLGGGVFDPNHIIVTQSDWISTDQTSRIEDWLFDADQDGVPDLGFLVNASPERPAYFAVCMNHTQGPGLRGTVYVDVDENGLYNGIDRPVPWATVHHAPAGAAAFSGPTGQYALQALPGDVSIACAPMGTEGPWTLDQGLGGHQVTLEDGSFIDGLDFGFVPAIDTSVVNVFMTSGNGPCGGSIPLWITFTNWGTRTESGTAQLELPNGMTFVSSTPAPTSVSGQVVVWDMEPLLPFGTTDIATVVTLPGVDLLGDTLVSQVTLLTTDSQGDPTGPFLAEDVRVHTCAYDPNDKRVSPSGYGAMGAIELPLDHLEYTIRFQNTGTDTAYSVVLRDPLAEAVDPLRIQLCGSSHVPSSITVDGADVLVIRFDDIMLPDSGANMLASQGYVTLRAGLRPDQTHLTEVSNTAHIHFDYNPPIITNTTLTTLVDCDLWQPSIDHIGVNLLEAPEGDAYQWSLEGVPLDGATERWLTVSAIGEYTVHVTSTYGCSATSAPYTFLFTGLAEHIGPSFALRPNPVNTLTRLLSSSVLTPSHTIELIDLQGRLLRTEVGNGSRELLLERDGLTAGSYVVCIRHAGELLGTVRLVLE